MKGVQRLLVVGAHAADFVWRAAGVIASVTANGGKRSSSHSPTVNAENPENYGRNRVKPSNG